MDVNVAGIESVSYYLASYFWGSLGTPIALFFIGAIFYNTPWSPSHHDKYIPVLFYVLFIVVWALIVVGVFRRAKALRTRLKKP